MKIEILEDNGSSINFALKDSTPAYANALRRIATNHVSSFAIDRVTFYENTSPMFDEYIAHRIGLIPIHTPNDGYSETDEILFTLEATGPKTVYSRELETSDKEVKVENGDIPLIKLSAGQRVRIDGKAVLGSGIKHAKFQPALVTYDQVGDREFNFYIESFGQMPPKEIINKAFAKIKEEIKEVVKQAKKL
ncbi:MAG TPA: DNA-directed RNA polymerase subunit D [Candidatus Acidoferrales bacterium]|nr:DNA-directed RNA polymerase subunit D [Candidatus Acidoferrales bacterium]